MNRRALIAILSAVTCGIVAVLLVKQYIQTKERDLNKGMQPVAVVAVAQDLPAGTRLSMDMLARRQVPQQFVHGNAVGPDDVDVVVGQTLNFPLKSGDSLLWTDLGSEAERLHLAGLAATITPGERAASIAVDNVGGVSGLLKPNDRVDILSTIRNQQTGEEATLTLLQNMTVLAVGTTLSSEQADRTSYNTLTLLVTLEEAELLVFAQEQGSLVAVLRNPEDIQTHKNIPKVTYADIMEPGYRQKIQQKRDRIEVIKKSKVAD